MTRRRAIMGLGGTALMSSLLSVVAWSGGYRLNLTPSEPLGLWRIEPPRHAISGGDLVFVCPPITPLFEEARRRGYLARGLCPGSVAPLVKAVAALPAQHVEIGDVVRIDGEILSSSRLRKTDGAGRSLTPFAGGIVPAGYLYLHSPFASSYDSRYFGPVPSTGLLGLARPVFTFTP
ncbi:conjugative transfer signal peptidase TraF [Mesorhizobium sp. SARCC-RB16n]|uniref:conjugative transfer signal peptidase TraF n=1 Tax=Mesorhizobium sp. SARCC-RB16n TaxID=2116687 RepID=UPI00122F419C|nr:conjugative transfer signal peptidase TraF [Mesorhizobium sp. SARCC-RB16n]KAA3448207.1 conjugative transfer signal peptidase TraF [Mesorhizobium sp. SARCC-RB16n]